jgi:4-amino-4-deoxychorismate lyase
MIISLNGRLCDEREAVVSVYDHGFLYGMGVFETFRTYQGKAFLLKQHLERLEQGCKDLMIDLQTGLLYWSEHVSQLLAANQLEDGYFRISVSGGTEQLGLPSEPYHNPTIILYIKPLPLVDKQIYRNGKPLQLLRLRRNTPEGALRLKSFHYMNNILAKRELVEYPWANGAEGLFLNEAGQLAEGIVSNLFFIRRGMCYTPELTTGILPGITRKLVIEIAGRIGLSVEQGLYSWDDLLAADEIFMTNSIQELVPVSTLFDIDGKKQVISHGRAGEITLGLLHEYQRLTNRSED